MNAMQRSTLTFALAAALAMPTALMAAARPRTTNMAAIILTRP
jgi:hypothetical protein